jgi:hypothetical protein
VTARLEVVDPRMPPPASVVPLAPRPRSLAGGRVLLFDNSKLDPDYGPYGAIFDALEQELAHAAADVTVERTTDDLNVGASDRLDEVADRVAAGAPTAVVIALCDWGVSQPSTILAAALERRGVPTVVIAAPAGFLQARATASRIVPGLPIVRLTLLRTASAADVARATRGLWDEVHEGLTAPPAELARRFAAHGAPRAGVRDAAGVIEVDGADPVRAFTARMAEDGLGDGFPLVPPTLERVMAFVAAAGRRADDEVWPPVTPRATPVTAREVAAVAVMAGCEPRWAPVVFAAYDAMRDPEFRLFQAAITTHPGGTLVLVSGPDTAAYGLASGRGALGPGFPANATVGRAVALSYSFLLGAQPGGSDLTSQGSPAEYSYCCAENLDESPWPGVHAEAGFPDQTTVTVVKCEGPHNVIDQKSVDPEHLLDTFVSTLATLGANTAYAPGCQTLVLLNPEHAAVLAGAGWSKRDVGAYLFARARNRRQDLAGRGQAPVWPEGFDELDEVPVVTRSEDFVVAVVGGSGPASQVAIPWGMGRGVTKVVARPA